MPSLTIAQITDLHARWHQPGTSRIAARRCRQMPALFRQALDAAVTAGADLIAVTGDLLDVPNYLLNHDDYYDYDRSTWTRDILADYRLFRDQLEATGVPYLVLPGNHDDLALLRQVFETDSTIRELGGYRLVTFWDRDFHGHMPRRFDRERTLFEQVLADPQSPPQIHLQHYLITPELNQHWPHTYLEGEALRRRIVQSDKVLLSLSGHYHRGLAPIVDGACTFAAAPAFAEHPHSFRLYRLEGERVEIETLALRDEPEFTGRPAVFLDRDGVLNTAPSWRSGPEDLAPVPGVGEALRALQEAGYALLVISSQSAVGHGYVSEETVDSVFDRLARFLQPAGVCFDAFYYSVGAGPHACHPRYEDQSQAKPLPYHLQAARDQFGLSLDGSYLIGDSLTDLQCARAGGVAPILVRTGNGRRTEAALAGEDWAGEVAVADDLGAAARAILQPQA